jgi:hypothetical protein
MKRPQQLVVDMMENTVQSVQCIQWSYVCRLTQPSLAPTVPCPASDHARLLITALSIT